MSESQQPSFAKQRFGGFADALVRYTDETVFGEVWERQQLSKRDRSVITVAALTAMGNVEQLDFHIPEARRNGVEAEEIVELITHLAFYAGWPRAMSAMAVAKKHLGKSESS